MITQGRTLTSRPPACFAPDKLRPSLQHFPLCQPLNLPHVSHLIGPIFFTFVYALKASIIVQNSAATPFRSTSQEN
jgi:hypothetical protein